MATKTECYVDTSAFIAFLDRSDLPGVTWIIKKYSDQNLTLADAHGLAVVRERRIGCCWSTDSPS